MSCLTAPLKTTRHCPICHRATEVFRKTNHILLYFCKTCHHRFAEVLAEKNTKDYHTQYDTGGFLASLEKTRLRQAKEISRRLLNFVGVKDATLDLGTGRGWFLTVLRERGHTHLAGADTSPLAVEQLKRSGFNHYLLQPGNELEEIRFQPAVVSLLDVIEHFPADRLLDFLSQVDKHFQPSLKLIIIKVPNSGGLLYLLAEFLSRFGVSGPLEQLYQVGTHPPHYQYFSRKSLHLLSEKLSWRVCEAWLDRDFESDTFAQRVRFLSWAPPFLGKIIGRLLSSGIEWSKRGDSLIFFLEPNAKPEIHSSVPVKNQALRKQPASGAAILVESPL